VVVFVLALDGGAYTVATRSVFAIALWWTILLLILANTRRLRRWPPAATIAAGLLLALSAWSFASMLWAPSLEDAFAEGNRLVLYLGVFVAGVAVSPAARHVAAGLAGGIVAVGVAAVCSRLFPEVVDPGPLADTVVAARARLSYPLGYWNGLAMFAGLGVPLLLGAAVTARSALGRAVTLMPIPLLVTIPYLASSRGGFVVTAVGTLLFLACTGRRWTALITTLVAATGAAAAVMSFASKPALVDTPGTDGAEDAAVTVAAMLLAVCVLTGVVHALARSIPLRRTPPAIVGWAILALAASTAIAAVAMARPVDRFEEFRRLDSSSSPTVQGHLFNVSSTGRWQQWAAAVDQFEAAPLAGGGAGSYGDWWLQHGSGRGFVTEAHSLYLEVLGELGIVGGAVLAAAIIVALGGGLLALLRRPAEERVLLASVFAAGAAYAVGAAIDWIWELTVVSVVGVGCLGLLAGLRSAQPRSASTGLGRAALAVAALAALALHANAFLVDRHLQASKRAASGREIPGASRDARAAADLAPWAAAPRVQLALLSELTGEVSRAQRLLGEAIERDESNWRLWLIAARLHVKEGNVDAARSALATARELNPRSSLFVLE
jgi:hypothetical protein